MELFCKGTPIDGEDILDFGNYVFSQAHGPIDFHTLLPKLYKDPAKTASEHYLIKSEGKIKAMVCVDPISIEVGGETLSGCGVGTVSVHPYARGKNYMKGIMDKAVKDMQRQKYDFSILGGQRQRYQYFGYDPAGVQYTFSINTSNIRHCCKEAFPENVSIIAVNEADQELIDAMYALHTAKKAKAVRRKSDFYEILQSWRAEIFVVLRAKEVVGYFTLSNCRLQEIVLSDSSLVKPILQWIFTEKKLDSLSCSLPEQETELLKEFASICESYQVEANNNLQIFHFTKVVKAFLALKASYTSLTDGACAFRVGEESFTITVKDNKIRAEREESEGAIELTPMEAISFFAGNGSFLRLPYQKKYPFLSNWFPIPFFIEKSDEC